MMTTDDDDFNLTRFSAVGDALTEVRPGARIFFNNTIFRDGNTIDSTESVGASGSRSPPRKTARLANDTDHSSSISRTRAKGKGRANDALDKVITEADRNGPVLLKIENLPDFSIPDAYLDRCSRQISSAILNVLRREPLVSSQEDIFQATRTVVSSGLGQKIFDRLRIELKAAATNIAVSLLGPRFGSDSWAWLQGLVDASKSFDESVELLEKLLTYLNCSFLSDKDQNVSLAASDMFEAHVLVNAKISERMWSSIRSWVHWERKEKDCHPKRDTIVSVVRILIEYHLFEESFLVPYLRDTVAFYSEESALLSGGVTTQITPLTKKSRNVNLEPTHDGAGSGTLSPQRFVDHCTQRIEAERMRAQTVLAAFEPCVRPIVQTTEETLMDGKLAWLAQGVVPALDERSKPALVKIYALIMRVDGLKVLCDAFKAHIQTTVENIVKDVGHEDTMVDRLMELKQFLDDAVQTAFVETSDAFNADVTAKAEPAASTITSMNVDAPTSPQSRRRASTSANLHTTAINAITPKHFSSAINDAFTAGFKARWRVPAEMIAKYLDRAMRHGQVNASDEAFEKLLSGALALYRYTPDKDVFRKFYHNALAKRLLMQRSASDDFEKMVLKKLKDQYDSEFSNGDHMFHDLALSRELTQAFHSKPGIEDTSATNLSVMVLQHSFWPFSGRARSDVVLPASMQADLSKFATFYKANHSGRKLEYEHSMGTAVLRTRFIAGYKELLVSLFQAVVLLLFNDADEIGFREIQQLTALEDGELRRTLQSLACGAKRVLKKEPTGRDVGDDDVFKFNAAFTDERTRVRINTIHLRETPEETKKTHTAVEGDRKHYLDAAIVRVMKARKTVPHKDLVMAAVDAVKAHFVPEVKTVKERIEVLIEQEYMRRDSEVDGLYVYVA